MDPQVGGPAGITGSLHRRRRRGDRHCSRVNARRAGLDPHASTGPDGADGQRPPAHSYCPTHPPRNRPLSNPNTAAPWLTVTTGDRPVMDPYSPAIAYTHFGFLFHNALVQQVWPFSPAKGPAFEPYLATQYTRSEDGAEWTFTLRQGVTFNDGEAFKADDVVATVERFLDQDFRIHSQAAGLKLVFKGVSEIDDHTVVLDTGAPDSTAFAWLSSPMTPILLEHQIRGDLTAPDVQGRWKYLGPAVRGGRTVELATGTGPFKMVTWDPEGGDRRRAQPQPFQVRRVR